MTSSTPDATADLDGQVLTSGTVEFLLGLLNSVSISASDPKLVERAMTLAQARDELTALRELPG